jgi:DNA-binding MarR family transcriptional regulator
VLHKIDPISGIGLHLDLVLRQIQKRYLSEFAEKDIEITIEQWVLLHKIYESGAYAAQADIVRTDFRNRATTSRVISGLERKGYILKDRFKGDRKRFRLSLTPEGQDLVHRALPLAKELRILAVEGIDEGEFRVFLRVLEAIRRNYAGADDPT